MHFRSANSEVPSYFSYPWTHGLTSEIRMWTWQNHFVIFFFSELSFLEDKSRSVHTSANFTIESTCRRCGKSRWILLCLTIKISSTHETVYLSFQRGTMYINRGKRSLFYLERSRTSQGRIFPKVTMLKY